MTILKNIKDMILEQIQNKANRSELPTRVSDLDNDLHLITEEDISGKADISSLSNIAFSGDYNDLINKPSISLAEHEHDIADIEGVEVIPVIITYTDNSTESRNLLFYTSEE